TACLPSVAVGRPVALQGRALCAADDLAIERLRLWPLRRSPSPPTSRPARYTGSARSDRHVSSRSSGSACLTTRPSNRSRAETDTSPSVKLQDRALPFRSLLLANVVCVDFTAGLPPECSFHGLRKAALTRLADAGKTVHQIAAVSGHKTLKEIER